MITKIYIVLIVLTWGKERSIAKFPMDVQFVPPYQGVDL